MFFFLYEVQQMTPPVIPERVYSRCVRSKNKKQTNFPLSQILKARDITWQIKKHL